jgi:outer membrane cobalamin receptor
MKTQTRRPAARTPSGSSSIEHHAGSPINTNGGAGFKTSVFVSGDGNCVPVVLVNGNAGDARADLAIYAAAKRLYCAA